MRRYERKELTMYQQVLVEYKCDRCGKTEKEAWPQGLCPVAIEVNYNEEGGSRDEYDYCNDCLVALADILVSAGSTAELVTGNDGD